MFLQCFRVGAADDFARVNRFHIGAVGDQDILAALHRRLVLQNAVLGDAHAVKPGTQRAQTAHHHCAFQCPDDIADNGPCE